MSIEMAVYALRRKPRTPAERKGCDAALECVGKSGLPLYVAEGDILRPFSLAELAAIEAYRPKPA